MSQTLRRLEERLGVSLVRRTTRSVHLTEAGAQLYASARPALNDMRNAVAAVSQFGAAPRGTLRIHVAAAAQQFLGGPMLAAFLNEHQHIQLDLFVSDEPLDIVAAG